MQFCVAGRMLCHAFFCKNNLVKGVFRGIMVPEDIRREFHMFKKLFIILTVFMPGLCFGALSGLQNSGEFDGGYYSDYDYGELDTVPGAEGMSEMQVVQELRHDIQVLDEQIATCERKRKGWVAATVVGGVGVVGTGIAALVQNSKIQEKKSELSQVKANVDNTDRQIQEANRTLNNM